MRLIDADELLSIVRSMTVVDKSVMHRILIQMPTVDAVPVVHGRWIDCDTQCGILCSVCGTPVDDFCHSIDYIDLEYKPNFCPNCGADMRKDGEAHGTK